MSTHNNRIGGGVVNEFNALSSTKSVKNSQKNIFKPLVATSLALTLGVSIGNASWVGTNGHSNYWNGSSMEDKSNKPSFPSDQNYAYTSFGSFSKGSGNQLVYLNSTTRPQNFEIASSGMEILVALWGNDGWNSLLTDRGTITINMKNSYLKFEDGGQPNDHFLGARNNGGKIQATFAGGSGSETINGVTYNNLAFYGGIILEITNNGKSNFNFSSGASVLGMLKAKNSNNANNGAGYVNADYTFSGGGNIFAITKDSYTGWGETNNIKDKAIVIDTGIGNSTKVTTTINITFGADGKKEYVSNANLLDNDGVIKTQLTGSEVSSTNTTLTADQTLITNAIKGNITVNGYNNVESVLNLKFFNNGLIEGLITTSSVAKVNIYFANKGTIRGDLSFGSGGDGTTGTLTIAKSEGEGDENKRVDDLTIEGNINNDGLTSYTLTADKFLMKGQASTGSGKGLTFDTYSATFEGFTLNNKGTVEIKSTKSLVISTNNDINTAGTLTITNSGDGTNSSITAKGIYGLGMASANSNSIITTKGNFNAGILAAIKDDGSGDGKIKTTLNIDNTNNDGKIVLSVLDSTSTTENLVFRGGKLNGATLNTNARLNDDGAIVAGTATSLNERGNIVLFNNMTGGKAEANFTAGTSSSISVVGDIYTVQGNNNLKLVDTDRNGTTLPEFIGNVTVNNGKANLIFDGTIWAPSNVRELLPSSFSSSSEAQVLLAYIKEYGTGKISTTNGGTANIVLRQGANSAFTQQAVFSIDTKGSSQSNILMQKHAGVALNIAASIDYDNQATTRVIFAGSNTDTSSEAFGGTTSFANVGTSGVQMLGVTYKDGVMFEVGAKTDAQRELIQRYKQVYSGPLLTLGAVLNGTTADLSIKGLFMGDAVALASSTKRTGATYNITIRTNAVVAGNIQNQSTDQLNVVMKAGSKIFLDPTVSSGYGTTNEFVTLDFQGATHDFNQDLIDSIRTTNTVIDLGTMGVDYGTLATQSFQAYNLLKIDSLSGENASFRVRVGDQNGAEKNVGANGSNLKGFADRVIVEATGNSQVLREFLQPIYTDNVNVDNIVYDANDPSKNIAVLTVKNDNNGDALVNLGALDAIEGFDQISSGLKAVKTNQNGTTNDSGDYTTYFLAQAESKGASQVVSEVSASALNLNYDLYLANINSLNKRMGELRNNDHSQGAWARVFSGAQTTTFAQETKSTYTTIQAGYDYAFGFEGANNYTGLALSYAMSSSSADSLIDINATTQGIDSVKSQAVELALYNAYVQDGASADNGFANGLYSDTILKFSYIMSDFNLIGQSNNYSTNNYALTFSQEVGYRFLLGESKEWFIDPQAELTVGYLNQTDLKQTLESGAYLDGVQDSILTLRGRVGANFGYKFDRWTESKGFKAQLYLGTYFEGDYISGGDVSLTTTRGIKTALTPLASTSRGVINVGTNFDVKDQHKIYFDFEKSFGGTIVTDYQVNVGYRFAFGENSGYTPLDPNKKSITPLKVSDENAKESEETQESVENTQENTQTTTSEQTSDEAKANSTEKSEAKSEEKAQ